MKKGCEDCFFGTIFVILSLVFALCYVYALVVGDAKILTKNFDCFGNVCGEHTNIYNSIPSLNMTTRKFLLQTSFSNVLNSVGVCVKHCPNETLESLNDLSEYVQKTGNRLCDCRVPEKMQLSQPRIGDVHLCPELPVPQTIPMRGLCVPVEWRLNPKKVPYAVSKKARKESMLRIRTVEDLDFHFSWTVPAISLVLTWGK
ncbi:hypothetical protein FBUS_00864 [Fasciolopsis buskii]|uniref:Uncharacterized protein n=1 Tax=Fasciolopsis buskii TaxID=27845 RepID=A0A8E0RY81_9TREM|nr:hypothetical protein FBUS_00864 [Fasciolopsis buski]